MSRSTVQTRQPILSVETQVKTWWIACEIPPPPTLPPDTDPIEESPPALLLFARVSLLPDPECDRVPWERTPPLVLPPPVLEFALKLNRLACNEAPPAPPVIAAAGCLLLGWGGSPVCLGTESV